MFNFDNVIAEDKEFEISTIKEFREEGSLRIVETQSGSSSIIVEKTTRTYNKSESLKVLGSRIEHKR